MTATDIEAFISRLKPIDRDRPLIHEPIADFIRWPIVSPDDHLLEPPDLFEGRLPRSLAQAAPHVVEDGELDYWLFEDIKVPISGMNGAISWSKEDATAGPVRYDHFRLGVLDVHHRIKDMNLAGVAASVCFPSIVFGFAGRRFAAMHDRELGLACMRAYNDWILEEWHGAYPDRLVAAQVAWLNDVNMAASEIRRNADRGFRAVNFTENPEKLGLPSIHTGYWDPFILACQETGTVINLHVGSSSETLTPSSDSPQQVVNSLFQVNAVAAASDWLFSLIPVRFPDIRLCLSEGGIGWVPSLLDRLEYVEARYTATNDGGLATPWKGEHTPTEVLLRNFWFSSIYDPSTFRLLDMLNADQIMMEVDYPHIDSTWPNSQSWLARQLSSFGDTLVADLTSGNAARLYQLNLDAALTALKRSEQTSSGRCGL